MLRGSVGKRLGWLAAAVLAWCLLPGSARAQAQSMPGYAVGPSGAASFGAPVMMNGEGMPGPGCASCGFGAPVGLTTGNGPCLRVHCPPAYRHCSEGPVCIKFCRGCPKPVCNPCEMPNWGYYQTCWTPWPWPQNWSHCPVQPPAATVQLNPYGAPPAVGPLPDGPLPVAPRPGLVPDDGPEMTPAPRRGIVPGL